MYKSPEVCFRKVKQTPYAPVVNTRSTIDENIIQKLKLISQDQSSDNNIERNWKNQNYKEFFKNKDNSYLQKVP